MLIHYLLDRFDGELNRVIQLRCRAVERSCSRWRRPGMIPRPANLIASGVFSKADVLPLPHHG